MSSQVPLNKFFNIDWQNWKKPIVYALLTSFVLHAILLAFKWHAESEQERRLKTPLSVVLVNASSPTAPVNPKRLAQVNLNGGGELTEGQASALRRADPRLAEQLEKIQADQKRLLSQVQAGRENQASTLQGKSNLATSESNPLEAELAKRLQKQGQQPRRATVTATSAKSVVFAQYHDAMRRQIEAHGTTHFPRVGGKALYGSLVLMVAVLCHTSTGSFTLPLSPDTVSYSITTGIATLSRFSMVTIAPFLALLFRYSTFETD